MVVTGVRETAQAVASALDSSARFAMGEICKDFDDLAVRMERNPAPAVLVDIDPEPARMLAGLETVAQRFGDARFVVLANNIRSDLVLEAMQVGARDFLVKQSIPSDLDGILRRLLPNGSIRPEMRGRVATVLSASGGCGATTLAINLARELNTMASSPALVVDWDEFYGGAATYLGLKGEFGLSNILARQGEIDPQLIQSTALTHSEGIHVLLSPASVNLAAPVPLELTRLGDAIRACRQAYKYIVVDAPRVTAPVARDLVNASDITLLVLQLTVKDIAMVKALLGAMRDLGAATDSIVPVVNRFYRRRAMITLDEARKALNGITLQCIENDYPSAIKALNYGQTLAQAAPRSILLRDIRKIAAQVFEARRLPVAV